MCAEGSSHKDESSPFTILAPRCRVPLAYAGAPAHILHHWKLWGRNCQICSCLVDLSDSKVPRCVTSDKDKVWQGSYLAMLQTHPREVAPLSYRAPVAAAGVLQSQMAPAHPDVAGWAAEIDNLSDSDECR